MAQQGYYSCACCGRQYRDDFSEEDYWLRDHMPLHNLQEDRPSDTLREVQQPNP